MTKCINGMVTVDECAKNMGLTSNQVIMGIREGDYVGQLIQNEWFVLPSSIDNGVGPSMDEIITAIKSGVYEGEKVYGNWFVLTSSIANRIGLSTDEIISRIRDGVYVGQKVNGKWFVSPSSISTEKKLIKSNYLPIRKRLLLWVCIPPSLGTLTDSMGFRNHTDPELVAVFIFGTLFILMLSWIVAMFSYSIIVHSRIRSNITSTKFGFKVWIIVFTWVTLATALGHIWNDIGVETWLESNNHEFYFN